MHGREYTFGLPLTATVRVYAFSEDEARELIKKHFYVADTNLGAWPDGSPILGEVTYNREDRCDLVEIEGCSVVGANDDEWEAAAKANGWTRVARDPETPSSSAPCLYHEDLNRVWPDGDWKGACLDICVNFDGSEI